MTITPLSASTAYKLSALARAGDRQSLYSFLNQTADTLLKTLVGLPYCLFSTASNTSAFTLTGAQIAGANDVTLSLTGALTSAQALTLPTPQQIVAAIPGAAVGQSYKLRIINQSSGAFAWTVTANGASTLTGGGSATIAQNTWRDYVVTLTSLTSVTFANCGTGAFS